MRTFHSGGVAEVDITQGLPRVTELFEKRMPKTQVPAVIAPFDGEVLDIVANTEGKNAGKIITIILDEHESTKDKTKSVQLEVHAKRVVLVKKGDRVKRGDLLTDGSADIEELFETAGVERAQDYIAEEVTKVYELQGASISRKHLDIIIKQMFARVEISDAGDTKYSIGDIIPDYTIRRENKKIKEEGKKEAKYKQIVQGITQASLTTESWLSAASFQNTTKILIKAATRGQTDDLVGLKENVMAGRLVPVGTGFRAEKKSSKIELPEEILEGVEEVKSE
jgi:DNA-directed RNA polymerase subunit beta'